jgi:hypothetical protein
LQGIDYKEKMCEMSVESVGLRKQLEKGRGAERFVPKVFGGQGRIGS